MQLLNSTINNTDHSIDSVQANINNANSNFSNISIEILNDDCIEHILSCLDKKQDLMNCKFVCKRFCRIIENVGFLYYQLYLEKNCLSPKDFLTLPKNYIISVDKGLKNLNEKRTRECSSIIENNTHLKRRLFYSIEKNLSHSKKIDFQTVTTITHSEEITVACFSKDNSLFATGYQDNIVKVFSFANGSYQPLFELKHIDRNYSGISNILFSPDNSYIITSSDFFHIIWYKSIGGYIQIQTIDSLFYVKMYFKNDSNRLFIKLNECSIKVFDLKDECCKQILSLHEENIQNIFDVSNGSFKNNVDLNPNIKSDSWLCFLLQLYSILFLCYVDNGHADQCDDEYNDNVGLPSDIKNMLYEIRISWRDIDSFIYSNDMKLMYVPHRVLPCPILEYTNNHWQIKLRLKRTYKALSFSQDNQRIITKYSCQFDNKKKVYQVTIWNITSNKAYQEMVLNNIHKVKFSPDSKYIIASYLNNKIKIWHLIDNAWRLKSSIQYANNIRDVYFSNYNWMIVNLSGKAATILKAISSDENTKVVTSLTNNKKIVCNQDIKILTADNIFFSTESNYFATIKGIGVQIWNYNTDRDKPIVIFKHSKKITNILFSQDKSHIIISSDFHITIYPLSENNYDKKTTIEIQEKSRVYFKADGKKIIIFEISGSIKVLKLVANNWQQDLVINKITDALSIQNGVFINKPLIAQFNDNWLSSMLQNQAIIEIAYKKNHNNNYSNVVDFTEQVQNIIYTKAHSLHYSLPKPNIISFSEDNKLMYLGFSIGNCVILENNNNQWSKKVIFDGGTSKVCFSKDNQRIITISGATFRDNIYYRLVVWNITTDNAYQELGLNNIRNANFSSDGTQMLTTSTEDNQVKIWSLLDDRWQFQQAIANNSTPCFANFSDDAKIIYIIFNKQKVKVIDISYVE